MEIERRKKKEFTQRTRRQEHRGHRDEGRLEIISSVFPAIGWFPASKLMFAWQCEDFALTVRVRKSRLVLGTS